jgi:hypothetical protein
MSDGVRAAPLAIGPGSVLRIALDAEHDLAPVDVNSA